ncbi:MAG: hypothetical protein HQK96_10355 [Nitrospirae bacterium]|nr:hypothetical protein [Nitrospirota bacterium]
MEDFVKTAILMKKKVGIIKGCKGERRLFFAKIMATAVIMLALLIRYSSIMYLKWPLSLVDVKIMTSDFLLIFIIYLFVKIKNHLSFGALRQVFSYTLRKNSTKTLNVCRVLL